MFCADGFKYYYFPIFISVIVDYKNQVIIKRVKTNMQYSIYHIFL